MNCGNDSNCVHWLYAVWTGTFTVRDLFTLAMPPTLRRWTRPNPSAAHRIEAPLARHPLECVSAAVLEDEAGTDHQVADRAGDEHLAAARRCAHARAQVHRQTGDVPVHHLALAGMEAGPD